MSAASPTFGERDRAIRIALVARHVLILVVLALFLLPLAWLLLTAFKPYSELFTAPPTILPVNGTLVNFTEGWTIGGGKGIGDSLIVSSISTAFCLLLGFPAAYALARRFPPHGQMSFTILSLRMLPPMRFATSCSTLSPTAWPKRSLIDLK